MKKRHRGVKQKKQEKNTNQNSWLTGWKNFFSFFWRIKPKHKSMIYRIKLFVAGGKTKKKTDSAIYNLNTVVFCFVFSPIPKTVDDEILERKKAKSKEK